LEFRSAIQSTTSAERHDCFIHKSQIANQQLRQEVASSPRDESVRSARRTAGRIRCGELADTRKLSVL